MRRRTPTRFTYHMVLPALLVLAALTSCGGGESSPQGASALNDKCPQPTNGPVALSIAARANTPKPVLPEQISGVLANAASAGKKITVIRADGRPQQAFSGSFSSNAANQQARVDDLRQFSIRLNTAISAVRARASEADPLTALSLAARFAGPGGTVAMVDSGLQTSEPLDFRDEGMLDANPGEVTDLLQRRGLLPDLTDRRVILAGIGDTAAPQAPLDNLRHRHLVDIWRSIVQRSGGCALLLDTPLSGDAISGVPPVSTVSVQPITINLSQACERTVLPDGGSLGFVPDQAEFRDPAAARDTLSQLAAGLVNAKAKATLVGTTSSAGEESGRLTLSAQRAEAVKTVLVESGVRPERISTEGVGTHSSSYVNDRAPDGTLLPGPAARNRSVIVTPNC